MGHFYDGDDRTWQAVAPARSPAEERRRASRYVAGAARDAADAALLLDVLGLTAVEGRDGTEKVA
jgi:hypothetical protein